MTLYCGGCIHEIEAGFGMVYRLMVEDGAVLGADHRLKFGDCQPNCAMCDECWKKVASAERLNEKQALETRGERDHVFAYFPSDSGSTPYGTKQWSSIKTGPIRVYLAHETVARFPQLLEIIDNMHKSQTAFATRQELCNAKKCDCSQQKRRDHDKGSYGLHAGTRVHWKERTPGTIWEPDSPKRKWIEGEVVRHEHPPHANYHRVKTEDGRELEIYEAFEGKAPRGNFGGCVGLSIPDRSKLDREKALAAFRVLWRNKAERILDDVPQDGTETGATFTGVAEEYAVFERLLGGSGVEADLALRPPTEAELKMLTRVV